MSKKQKIAIVAPPVLIGMMVPIFRLFAEIFPEEWRIGWYLGLVAYWVIWGGVFSWLMIGKVRLREIVRPRKVTTTVFLLVLLPLLIAALYRIIAGNEYEKPSVWIFLLLISTNSGNGFFEEVFWRGVYMELFPGSVLLRIVWPSVWFGLWYYVPGSVSPDGGSIGVDDRVDVLWALLELPGEEDRNDMVEHRSPTVSGFIAVA